MLDAVIFAGVLLTSQAEWMPCQNIPDEPEVQEATSEGPKGLSGLYEHNYDLGGGRRLITQRRIMDMTLDAGLEATYTLQSYPLLYVVVVPGRADALYVDQGHGLLGTPQGLCGEIFRYQ